MPSRKKSKGQARKAAGAAASAGISSHKKRNQLSVNKCLHGSHSAPPQGCSDEACGEFIRTLYQGINGADVTGLARIDAHHYVALNNALQLTHEKFPEVMNNDINRNTVINHITSEGTNHLLMERPGLARPLVQWVMTLENYEKTKELHAGRAMTYSPEELMQVRDAMNGCPRSVTEFFAKRISCSCLDDTYKEAKEHEPKVGICDHCNERVQSKSLSICSGCKMVQYCSRECQRSAWPNHKAKCKQWERHQTMCRYTNPK